MVIIDRFELLRDSGNRIVKGWRIERYTSTGKCVMQHLRSGKSKSGVIDDFGDIIDVPTDEVYYHPGQTHNGYMS